MQTNGPASRTKKQPTTKAKAMAKTTAKQTKSQAQSLLLDKIPAEVRNQIWRDVLVTDTFVLVNKDEPHQPALLRTCKQIREEATSIYFNENGFMLPMDGYDSTLGLQWCNFAVPHFKDGMAALDWEREAGTETWEDLKIWLQLTHAGLVPRYSPTYYPIGCDEQAEEMFDFLEEHARLPWKKLLPKLEKQKNYMEDREGLCEFGLFDNPGSDC